MENPTDAGAMRRSASSSRKSRIPSTGNRRRSLPRDIGTVLPVVAAFPAGPWPFQVGRLAGLVSPAGYPTLASYAGTGNFFTSLPSELINAGPYAGRVVVAWQPQQWLPALVLELESRIPRITVSPVGPDHL